VAWVDGQLHELFGLGAKEDVPVEIDLDEVLQYDGPKRIDYIKNLLRAAKNQADVPFFAKSLVKKLEENPIA